MKFGGIIVTDAGFFGNIEKNYCPQTETHQISLLYVQLVRSVLALRIVWWINHVLERYFKNPFFFLNEEWLQLIAWWNQQPKNQGTTEESYNFFMSK